jgi:hypothetical protein
MTPPQRPQSAIQVKFSLWDNPEFLERLQEFIMGEPSEGRYLPSTESFFER